MKNTSAVSTLLMKYAENVSALRIVRDAISDAKNNFTEVQINYLEECRECWYDSKRREWNGWECAVQSIADASAVPPPDAEMKLAKLWDKRVKLHIEGGHLKTSLCAVGRSLLREQNTYYEESNGI